MHVCAYFVGTHVHTGTWKISTHEQACPHTQLDRHWHTMSFGQEEARVRPRVIWGPKVQAGPP